MNDTAEILYDLKEKFSVEINKLENVSLRDCLEVTGKPWQKDYYETEWGCIGCEKVFQDETKGFYFNTGHSDGASLCTKCLDSAAKTIFYQAKKCDYDYCSICEEAFRKERIMPFRSRKNNTAFIGDCCFKSPDELTESVKKAMILVDKEIKKVEKNEKQRIDFINSAEVTAQPYIEAGLPKTFAIAIGKGVDPAEVLSLWESEWWKQYPDDDPLLVSVLDGKFTEDDARYVNDIRSDHDLLAAACIQQKITIQWAKALLDCGFNEYPKSVEIILKGADPLIISRLHKIDCNKEIIPPKLTEPVIMPSMEE